MVAAEFLVIGAWNIKAKDGEARMPKCRAAQQLHNLQRTRTATTSLALHRKGGLDRSPVTGAYSRDRFSIPHRRSLAYKDDAMPADRIVDEDEEYQSSQDSDFAPDDAPDAASGSSDSEDEPDEAARKRRRPVNEAKTDGGDDYENSGDEAIIEKGRKRQKRARAKGEAVDDEGGEGGLIKTRRQRAAEYALSPQHCERLQRTWLTAM